MNGLLDLGSYNLPILGIALAIGVLTARLAFRRPAAPEPAPDSKAEDSSQT